MRTKKILSPLGAIILALPLFQGVCPTSDRAPAELTITTAALHSGTTGASYSQNFAATGGTPPYAWELTSGSVIPAGLTLSAGGVLSGTPTVAGEFSFAVQVHDDGGLADSKLLALSVVPGVQVATTSFPGQVQNAPFSVQLAASGGTPPYTWSVSSGTLPPGVTLSASGVLAGTVSAVGATLFTVRATDAANRSATQDLTINVMPSAISIISGPNPDAMLGLAYASIVVASGGGPPYTWSVGGGTLPAGLLLTSGGVIEGTPSASGASTFTLHVADNASNAQDATYTITVQALIVITTPSLPDGLVGASYLGSVGAFGGVLPYTWTLNSGTLPPGLVVDPVGKVVGTLTTAGTYTFTLQVADKSGVATRKSFTIVVSP